MRSIQQEDQMDRCTTCGATPAEDCKLPPTRNCLHPKQERLLAAVVPDGLREEVRDALEGDSNDAEHDALVSVAEFLGVKYDA
jgi:hypothetical protein